jgi:hypothetical protein
MTYKCTWKKLYKEKRHFQCHFFNKEIKTENLEYIFSADRKTLDGLQRAKLHFLHGYFLNNFCFGLNDIVLVHILTINGG